MTPILHEIVSFLSETLAHSTIKDTSLNGLQVDGNSEVTRVAVTVDASLETVRQAISESAQLLIVHHGLFWDKPATLTGALGETTRELIQSGISLFASHLPLDAHATLGNNAILARLLELDNLTPAFPYYGSEIGWAGENARGFTLHEMRERLATLPGADLEMLMLPFGPKRPTKVGIVSGSGADALYGCAVSDIDTLITGEPRQFAYH